MSRRAHATLVFLALGLLILPTAHIFVGFWAVTGERAAEVAAERRGVAYLGPLVRLVGALSEAQSAAVRKQAPDDGALRAAVAEVAAADREHGAALGVTERWSPLRKAVEKVAAEPPRGREALHRYGELSAQALGLVGKAGAASGLEVDRQFDARDTLLRLPDAIVYSGLVADLMVFPTKGDQGQLSVESHAALGRLRVTRDVMSEGLRQGEGVVASTAGLDSLDAFTAAVSDLLVAAAPVVHGEWVSESRLEVLGARVRGAALPLADEMLRVIDSALREREGAATHQRWGTGAVMVFGLLLGAVLLWLSLLARGGAAARAPDSDGPGRGAAPEPLPPEFVGARGLLSSEELIHAGRAVRATRGARNGAS